MKKNIEGRELSMIKDQTLVSVTGSEEADPEATITQSIVEVDQDLTSGFGIVVKNDTNPTTTCQLVTTEVSIVPLVASAKSVPQPTTTCQLDVTMKECHL